LILAATVPEPRGPRHPAAAPSRAALRGGTTFAGASLPRRYASVMTDMGAARSGP